MYSQAQASPVYDPKQATFPIIIPPIPRAALPSLAKSHASPAVLGTSSPSPKKPRPPPSDVFGPAVAVAGTGPLKGSVMMLLEGSKPNTSPIKSSKVSDRAKAMRERVSARNTCRAKHHTTYDLFFSHTARGQESRSVSSDCQPSVHVHIVGGNLSNSQSVIAAGESSVGG